MNRWVLPQALRKMACYPDGEVIVVARPTHAELAVTLATQAVDGGAAAWRVLQDRLTEECGPYTFAGYLSAREVEPRELLDSQGSVIDTMKPGDSMLRKSEMENTDGR